MNTKHSTMIPFLRHKTVSFQSLKSPLATEQSSKKSKKSVASDKDRDMEETVAAAADMHPGTKGKATTQINASPAAGASTAAPPTVGANKISSTAPAQQQQPKVQRMSSVKLQQTPGTPAAGGAAAAGGHKLFRNLSARFHPSIEAIPVVETVAQEYARTIKALWRMVEEEELSYQIDAAATAARLQQEELQRLLLEAAERSKKPRHNYKTFPGQRELVHTDDDGDIRRQLCRDVCCKSRSGSAAAVHGGNRQPSSSSELLKAIQDDDEEDDIEDHEQRLRELQQVERELVMLGLQRYQDASTDNVAATLAHEPASSSPTSEAHPRQYDSRRESFQESKVQPVWTAAEQQTTEQQAKATQQSQPRRQRPRQNSLAYEERRADLDALRAQVKATTAVETATTKTTTTTPLLDFNDGIRSNDKDDDDDAVVLAVARRVSVRMETQSHHDWSQFLGQDRQRPSYDVERARGRGASWAPPPRTTTLANAKRHSRMASMSEVKTTTATAVATTTATPVMSTMVSAR
ncbi:hypothetical protein BGX31_009674 [Mortierella sp. GBA43]|nr:hypothetical protein BGX31_009674 [Mortierella sp. GBA43]